MQIYPAIDLYEGKAVRLFKGDYAQMTVYNENPVLVAQDFLAQGKQICVQICQYQYFHTHTSFVGVGFVGFMTQL